MADHEETGIIGPGEVPVTLIVNGRRREVRVEPRTTLLDALRQKLDLTGTKRVCDSGACGACTVLLDGVAVYACMTLAVSCDERSVQTIEGLAHGESLHPIQQAFIDEDGYQCGFCTPGQIMAAKSLIGRTPEPTRQQIIEGMSGNLCRCGAYQKIIAAVERAARAQSNGSV
ncbi:MAG: (2Fe-2S)-binding protein [Spirochaetaceae bacterium]|nr:MAG: (2Fe-2S)-binding protein [Spirochaetaceae bacterium]